MNRCAKLLIAASLVVFCFALSGYAVAKTDTAPQMAEVDKLLEKIAVYEEGQSRENLIRLDDIVRESHNSPQLLRKIEEQFLKFLRSDASLSGKQFVCGQLAVIGSEDSVPPLAAMLTAPETADIALYALEQIPGAAVDKVMIKALDKTSGKTKVGIVNTLGKRGNKASVMPLAKLLGDKDKEVAQAAIAALGKIADPLAAEVLSKALKKAHPGGSWHNKVADAYLNCAHNLAAVGNKKAAADIYTQLFTPAESVMTRTAALTGLVDIEPDDALKLVIDAINNSKDRMSQVMAISLSAKIPGTEATKVITAQFPNLLPPSQAQLLYVLADRKDPAALPVVVTAVKSENQLVRVVALEALASLGDSSTVPLLAQSATQTTGEEQANARYSLYNLSSPGVDEAIIELIQTTADPNVKVELVRSVGERNIKAALQALLKTANDPDAKVRLESVKVLKNIADASTLPALVDILVNAKNDAEMKEAGKTFASVARKYSAEKDAAGALLNALSSAKNVNLRCALLESLGIIGDPGSLDLLRMALKDDNTEVQTSAVRALSEWSTDAPAADLLEVAKSSTDQIRRTLALRGYIRLTWLNTDRPSADTLKMLTDAAQLAERADEKNLILSVLSNVKDPQALNMAVPYLNEKATRREAAVAIVKIAEFTINDNPDETAEALKKVLDFVKAGPVRGRARELLKQIEAVKASPAK
ncbi:MAG: HEAT repeat domain-containing protein [Sedimentisphaerales bacterium]|nr:HEAT repeat domain-containing protein [Sedimentisphaerales bacterium]